MLRARALVELLISHVSPRWVKQQIDNSGRNGKTAMSLNPAPLSVRVALQEDEAAILPQTKIKCSKAKAITLHEPDTSPNVIRPEVEYLIRAGVRICVAEVKGSTRRHPNGDGEDKLTHHRYANVCDFLDEPLEHCRCNLDLVEAVVRVERLNGANAFSICRCDASLGDGLNHGRAILQESPRPRWARCNQRVRHLETQRGSN